MLTKQNCGKYLTKEFHEMQEKGYIDRTQLTDEQIAWCELPADVGKGNLNPETFKIETQPIDHSEATGSPPITTYDIRTRPECGDKEDL